MINKFKKRATDPERMDAPNVPRTLLYRNLYELNILNRTAGGHTITMNGIKRLVTDKTKTYHIVDIGCGGGDTLKCIADWAASHRYKVRLTGVDKNPEVINYLHEECKDYAEIQAVTNDHIHFLDTSGPIDILHCALFCHHLSDDELVTFFRYFKNHATTGFIINDLQRSFVAYYAVKLLTYFFRGSELAKHDGPLSVLKGFKKKELQILLQKAGILNFGIQWKWPFRYLVIGSYGK